jgi:hypothetical protein
MEEQIVPVIVLIGKPDWKASIETLPGFELVTYTSRDGYVSRLVADHAAMVIVDGGESGWRFWVTTPKASPASRRIPVVVVADDPAVREAAPGAGADFTLSPEKLAEQLPELIRDHAHIQRDGDRLELLDQCAESLPPRAQEAVQRFNAGEYYKQHDLFEAQWMEEDGPVRDLYQAVLQVGIAYYQIIRGNRRGAIKMLLRSFQWLNMLPDVCQGINVAKLRADATRVYEVLEAMPPGADLSDFDRGLLRPVEVSAPDRTNP